MGIPTVPEVLSKSAPHLDLDLPATMDTSFLSYQYLGSRGHISNLSTQQSPQLRGLYSLLNEKYDLQNY